MGIDECVGNFKSGFKKFLKFHFVIRGYPFIFGGMVNRVLGSKQLIIDDDYKAHVAALSPIEKLEVYMDYFVGDLVMRKNFHVDVSDKSISFREYGLMHNIPPASFDDFCSKHLYDQYRHFISK